MTGLFSLLFISMYILFIFNLKFKVPRYSCEISMGRQSYLVHHFKFLNSFRQDPQPNIKPNRKYFYLSFFSECSFLWNPHFLNIVSVCFAFYTKKPIWNKRVSFAWSAEGSKVPFKHKLRRCYNACYSQYIILCFINLLWLHKKVYILSHRWMGHVSSLLLFEEWVCI